jgi:hypothetical protein
LVAMSAKKKYVEFLITGKIKTHTKKYKHTEYASVFVDKT